MASVAGENWLPSTGTTPAIRPGRRPRSPHGTPCCGRQLSSQGENTPRGCTQPALVVVVHDEPKFSKQTVEALRLAGYEVAAFIDPMAALDALENAQRVEVLITRVRFPLGKPNGIALALMARHKRPGIKVLFTARPEFARHAEGVGEFMPVPIDLTELVAAVGRLLRADC
jgi:DNA-binding NtrC family response regulator